MPILQHRRLLFSGTSLKPDLFEFRADVGTFEDAGLDPTETTDPVYQWNTPTGSVFATQATLSLRPTVVSSARPNYLAFDGADDYMLFNSSRNYITAGSPFSYEAWVRLTDFATTSFPLIAQLRSDNGESLSIGFSNSASYLGLRFGSTNNWARLKTDTAAATLIGADKHVIITYNGGGALTAANFTAYIDGVPQTLTAAGAYGAAPNNSNAIGAAIDGVVPWKGRIYKMCACSKVISAADAVARYTLGANG